MKRVLLVHFSQSGQLTRIARQLVAPLAAAADVRVVEEVLRPRAAYPFPWPLWRFLDAMPESVLLEPPALEPLRVHPGERFDLVVLAYQVWYLAPCEPVTAFLKSPAGRELLRGRPVVTLIACRNMWLTAQETVKRLIREAGGVLLLIGLFTRPVAFVLCGEMAFAYFMAHGSQGYVLVPMLNRGELAVLYCFVFLFFAAAGAGAWSVDAMRRRGPLTA